MTDTTALRDLLERALDLEAKAAGPASDEVFAELSVEELKARVAELEDEVFALSHSTLIDDEVAAPPAAVALVDDAQWDDDWDDDTTLDAGVDFTEPDDADGAVLIDPALVGKDFGDLEAKDGDVSDEPVFDDDEEPVADEAKDFDYLDLPAWSVETKDAGETLSEMELLLARRAQLDA